MAEKPRVAICVPSYGQWTIAFRSSFIAFIVTCAKNPDYNICYIESNRTYRHMAREQLCDGALELDPQPDYLFFVDSDSALPLNAIERLMAHDKDIVSGLYHHRSYPYTPVAYQWTQNPIKPEQNTGDLICPLSHKMGKELIKVGAVGFGCILIKTEALKRIPRPLFLVGQEREMFLGEDVFFARQAFKAGVEIWLDPTVVVGHITDETLIVVPENAIMLKERDAKNGN